MPSPASSLAADPRLGPYAVLLFLAVLFNALFCFGYYRRGQVLAQAREKARSIIQAAAGITSFRPVTRLSPLLYCVLITAFFGVAYVSIYQGLSRPPGAGRIAAGGFSLVALFPWGLMLAFAVTVLRQVMIQRATKEIAQYLRRADYDGALARIEQLLRRFPHSPRFLSLRGVILLLAGKLTEAEQALRSGLEAARISVIQHRGSRVLQLAPEHTLMLVNLGYVLLADGRLTDAASAFEGATKLLPVCWDAYNGLAEVSLLRGGEPHRALELVDKALELKKENDAQPAIDRHVLAYIWANRARAQAALGLTGEAKESLDHAASQADPEFVPGFAGTLWRSGLALLRMDLEAEAMQQFKRAKEIDPQGLYGQMSGEAIQENSVTTECPQAAVLHLSS
jgi:tetratricopeptide (TPR) repeat protein